MSDNQESVFSQFIFPKQFHVLNECPPDVSFHDNESEVNLSPNQPNDDFRIIDKAALIAFKYVYGKKLCKTNQFAFFQN